MGLSSPRSPLPRIKHLLKVQTTPTKPHAPTPHVPPLPDNVLALIGQHCSLLRDVFNFSLTCRRARAALAPQLYSTVELKTNKQCKSVLTSLAKHPELAEYVRCLIVRPNSAEWTPSGEEQDEGVVAELVMRLTSDLEYLESFTWDGLEMPEDTVWLVLRTSCPLLKRISTTIGDEPLNSASHLYDFSNLLTLELIVKCTSFEWLSDGPLSIEKLPRRFWQMLLERTPHLESLTLGGPAPSPRLFDVRHLTLGRWPRLRSLTLGDTAVQPHYTDEAQALKDDAAFMRFLCLHPALEEVNLGHASGSLVFPRSFALPPGALPNVEAFSGPLKFLRTLPHLRLVKKLNLTGLHHAVSSFPPTCKVLREMGGLVELRMWINLSFGGGLAVGGRRGGVDDGQMFEAILGCCPGLLHFEVLCFTRPSFHTKEFSLALRTAPHLLSFSLTKIHKSSDEPMQRSALRIVRENPNLHRFTLRYTYDAWLTQEGGGRVKQVGNYEVVRGGDGVPVGLVAYECGGRTWGAGAGGRGYVLPVEMGDGEGGGGSGSSGSAGASEGWSPRSSLSSSMSRASKLSRSSR